MRRTSVQGEASDDGIGDSWIKGTVGKRAVQVEGITGAKILSWLEQAQLKLRKVSLPLVKLGKGLGMMKRCGQTLEALLSYCPR